MSGSVEILETQGSPATILLDGNSAAVKVGRGAASTAGAVTVLDAGGLEVLRVVGADSELHLGTKLNNGDLYVYGAEKDASIHLDGEKGRATLGVKGSPGELVVSDNNGNNGRSEEHTSELQSLRHLVCRLLLE